VAELSRAVATDAEAVLARPVLIVGSPRSGTATIAGMLRAHPDVAYLREPRLVWRFGNDDRSDMLEPSDARPEVIAHIRKAFAAMVRGQNGSRMVEKTPSNALRIPFVDAVLPDCRVVHVIRNGPDAIVAIRRKWLETPHGASTVRQKDRVRRHLREMDWRQMSSYAKEASRQFLPASLAPVLGRRTWGPRLPGIDALVRELDLLEVCALQWRTCVERACHFGRMLGSDRYLEVRLEEMTVDTAKAIAVFCDLDHPAVVDGFSRQYDPHMIVSRGDAIDSAERARIMAWIEPTIAYLDQT